MSQMLQADAISVIIPPCTHKSLKHHDAAVGLSERAMDEDTTTHKPSHAADVCGTFTGRPMTSFAWFIFIGLSCSRRVDELSRG